MVMNPERVRSSEDHSPKKLMLSEEIIPEKSGGETSSREMVYEVFVYPFPKIGLYVSVTRTGHRVGAASKREGWGGGYTSPSGCLPYLPHSLLNLHKSSLTLVSASVSLRVFAGIAESGAVFVLSLSSGFQEFLHVGNQPLMMK